jgi:phosphoribosylpyrophosphate synthetase
VLRYYKDVPADTTLEQFRATQENFQWQVAALLARFTRDHKQCIVNVAGAEWNTVALVPSGRDRGGSHPLEQAIQRIPWLRGDYARLLRRTGAVVAPHRADSNKYETTQDVTGRRILLVDDTFTSGGSVQSAATVLHRGRAQVVATLVIGRVVRPEYSAAALALWKTAWKKTFRFEECCLRDHSS